MNLTLQPKLDKTIVRENTDEDVMLELVKLFPKTCLLLKHQLLTLFHFLLNYMFNLILQDLMMVQVLFLLDLLFLLMLIKK